MTNALPATTDGTGVELFADDHSKIDTLIGDLLSALEEDKSKALARLDLLWARLAVKSGPNTGEYGYVPTSVNRVRMVIRIASRGPRRGLPRLDSTSANYYRQEVTLPFDQSRNCRQNGRR